ncbi:DNA glycosylase [Lobosporangium transversale]|uniref:DNA glycosylase n=1 Tax=Lobosporangium transversale TaxID=64571 RepID=A0A1Y2GEK8_9FUNG|nr:DNA glycosylase [Lobosporangium transversale]ORZ07746.1 DNA glycosylase [Lobosporangium transversale]|eukprot:XP_021878112.1 DNA glycosylase [Lobosporangium transversale]
MEIDSTKTAANTNATIAAVATAKDSKPNVPEVDPWTKRPKHIPSYAEEALAHLCKADPALAPLIAKYPYSIYSDHDTNYFRVLTRTILGQQIHWKAARSIIYKFVSYYFPDQVTLESLDAGDKRFPSPEQVLATSMDILRQRGLSERKASYVQDLARHFAEGKITFTDKAALQSMTDEEVASQLLCVRGIGPWTVDMFMMDSLERLDVLPTLDLGIRRGMEKHFRKDYKNGVWGSITEEVEITEADMDTRGSSSQVITKVVTKKKSGARGKGKAKNGEMTCEDMERMAERWRPYRTIASWYMWRNADDEEAIKAPII